MRRWITLLASLALCGCAQLPGRVAPDAAEAAGTFAALQAAGGPERLATLLERNASTRFRPLATRDGVVTWVSPEGVSLAFRDGFLIATRGLGGDVMASDADAVVALVTQRRAGRAERFVELLGGDNRIEQRAFVCDIRVERAESIDVAGRMVAATLMVEDCASRALRVVNTYWVDGAGRVLHSRQWAGEFAGPINFTIIAP